MTSTATAARPVLDFELSPGGTLWTVFDATTGEALAEGEGWNRAKSIERAMAFIAERDASRVWVLRTSRAWLAYRELAGEWAPLPFTPEAEPEAVQAFVAALASTGGRPVAIYRD